MNEIVTGDDPVTCHLCGKETSVAMIARHLHDEHGIAYEDIADAEIIDTCPNCGHFADAHDENGCDLCECTGP